MKIFFLILFVFGVITNLPAQTIDDIGKIVIGVKILPTATPATLNNKTILVNKLISLAANAGFTSYGTNCFYITPSVIVDDVRVAEGGMKNIYVVKGEVYLTIQAEDEGVVFSGTSFVFSGTGKTENAAINNGLQGISNNDIKPFFDNAKQRILEYYYSKQSVIFAKAEMLADNGEYDAAIACLLTIPEELFDVYHKALEKACDIYSERDEYIKLQRDQEIKDSNSVVLVKARNLMAKHDAYATLEALWDYTIAGTEQDQEYYSLLKQAESIITAAEQVALAKAKQEYEDRKLREEREYADRRQEYMDNVEYRNRLLDIDEKEIDNKKAMQSEITDAVKSVALAYIKRTI